MKNLQPKYSKFKKTKKGTLKRFEFKKNKLKFGTLGLKAFNSGIITSKQLEAARQCLTKKIKKKGKIWLRIFPDLSITTKSLGVRMGNGKGNLSHWSARIASGTIIFEACGLNTSTISLALKNAGTKLPIKTKIVI